MEENKSAEEMQWKIFSHTYPLGDTGDYQSTCGITNHEYSFYCESPDDITDEELQEMCDKLNAAQFKQQSAGVWVKSSERLPDKEGAYFCKSSAGFKKVSFFNGKRFETEPHKNVSEWLDEVPQSSLTDEAIEKMINNKKWYLTDDEGNAIHPVMDIADVKIILKATLTNRQQD